MALDEATTIFAVDIAGFSGPSRTRANYVALREGMYQAVEQAFLQSGVPWADCYQEGAGDGILALAPATVRKSGFVGNLPLALVSALQAHNAEHPPEERIRLRLVLHAGEVTRDERGVDGPAIIHAFRLLDSAPLKAALAESTGVLAIIASARFYDEVIRQRPEYAPEEYEQVSVAVKETHGIAWVRLPDGERHTPGRTLGVECGTPVVVAPAARPASPEFYQVVDAIEALPCMQDEHTRSSIVDQLRFAGAIRYFPNRRAHVASILRTCLDFEDGVVQLVTAISEQEPSGSIPLNRLVTQLSATGTSHHRADGTISVGRLSNALVDVPALKALARPDRDRVSPQAPADVDHDVLTSMLAFATLCRPRSERQADALLERMPALLNRGAAEIETCRAWLANVYSGQYALNPVPGKNAGDQLIADALSSTPELVVALTVSGTDEQIFTALTVLGNAQKAHPELAGAVTAMVDANPGRILPIAGSVVDQLAEPEPFLAAVAAGTSPESRDSWWNTLEDPQARLPGILRTTARNHFWSDISGTRLPIDADARLLGAPAVTAMEMRRRGADPCLHGLIRLWPEQGGVRLPSFQFTPTGEPRPLVLEINILLGVSEDPWGVADWWLSPNTWLTGVPADLLDNVDEDRLRAAAAAAVEG